MTHREELDSLRTRGARIALDDLHSLFDRLPAIDRSEMLGEWQGGVFDTGHAGEKQLGMLAWVGKTFHGLDDVDPIVSRDAAGARFANPVLGKATLRNVEYRGVVTGTMVYDQHPIFDHFRRVDARTVLGCMDRKGDRFPLYFWLEHLG